MINGGAPDRGVPRLERLRVKNFRALYDLDLNGLQPLTVFLGPNGSGKSTVLDVFAFLSECFTSGLRKAWDDRGRLKELRTRGADGPITIELKYRERPRTSGSPLLTYHLALDEDDDGPFVAEEWLQWRRNERFGRPFKFLDFQRGSGTVISGETPEDKDDERVPESLASPDLLAVNTLGQLSRHPRVAALRKFIAGWYLSYLTAENTRSVPRSGPQERLTVSGDNLPNVLQYLSERHPERLDKICSVLAERVPRLERVYTEIMQDGRLLLRIKDGPFDEPILSEFASDGTLKLLAYLTILYDPDPPHLVGIEEPENQLHPRLLELLAEECRKATSRTQLTVTTHSPFFVNGLRPNEVWVLFRDENGHTQAHRTDRMDNINDFVAVDALLGDLWMENFFDAGDPLTNAGGPLPPPQLPEASAWGRGGIIGVASRSVR